MVPERVKTTRMIAVLLELSGVDAPHVAPYPDPINPLHTPAPPGAHLAGICLWVWDVGGWLVHVGAGTAMARPVLVRFERHFCWLLLLIFELPCAACLAVLHLPHLLCISLFWRMAPFGALWLCTHCAHRVGPGAHAHNLAQRVLHIVRIAVSAAYQLVQLRCLHLHFFRRAICEASTLPGDRHPSRLHAKKIKR